MHIDSWLGFVSAFRCMSVVGFGRLNLKFVCGGRLLSSVDWFGRCVVCVCARLLWRFGLG